jgi:hypothetical protein
MVLAFYVFWVTAISATSGVIYVLNQRIKQRDAEITGLRLDNALVRRRLWDTERYARDVVTSVVPLVAKSDWMTGRWKGQFNTLQQLEQERNDAVDNVRRKINSIPLVQEVTKALVDDRKIGI